MYLRPRTSLAWGKKVLVSRYDINLFGHVSAQYFCWLINGNHLCSLFILPSPCLDATWEKKSCKHWEWFSGMLKATKSTRRTEEPKHSFWIGASDFELMQSACPFFVVVLSVIFCSIFNCSSLDKMHFKRNDKMAGNTNWSCCHWYLLEGRR